jgi:hypothetical protein
VLKGEHSYAVLVAQERALKKESVVHLAVCAHCHGIFLSIITSAASLHWSIVSWSAAPSQTRIKRMASVYAAVLVARAPKM